MITLSIKNVGLHITLTLTFRTLTKEILYQFECSDVEHILQMIFSKWKHFRGRGGQRIKNNLEETDSVSRKP